MVGTSPYGFCRPAVPRLAWHYRDSGDIEPLANSVADSGGVYFVPAFSGLFAPFWRSDARGVIVGLTRHSTKAHNSVG